MGGKLLAKLPLPQPNSARHESLQTGKEAQMIVLAVMFFVVSAAGLILAVAYLAQGLNDINPLVLVAFLSIAAASAVRGGYFVSEAIAVQDSE